MAEDATEAVATEEVTPPADNAAETDKPESPSATAKAEAAAESPSADEAEADGESEPKEWVNLVGKFDGDKEKIGKEFWRYANSNAELAKKVKDLEAAVAAKATTRAEDPKPEAKPEKPAAEHPSIQKLESTITALESETSTLQTKGATKYQELQSQTEAILELKAEIKIQGDLADEGLKQRLILAQDRKDLLATQLEDLADRFRVKRERLEDAKGKREAVRAEADAEGKRQAEQQKKDEEFNAQFPQQVDALVFQAADELGLVLDDKQRHFMWRTASADVMAYLFKLGRGTPLPDGDLQEKIRGFVKDFAEVQGIAAKAKYAGTSKEKAKVASHKLVPGQPLVNKKPTPTPTPGLIDDAIAGDKKLMEARQKWLRRFSGAA